MRVSLQVFQVLGILAAFVLTIKMIISRTKSRALSSTNVSYLVIMILSNKTTVQISETI